MAVSLVFSRSGGLDDETGLFVLEGSTSNFLLRQESISAIGKGAGHEFQSSLVFQEDKTNRPVFINKQKGYSTKLEHMSILLHTVTKSGNEENLAQVAGLEHGIYGQLKITKIADKRYITEFFGASPPRRAIKVIMRELGVATKRTILFALGIPPGEGGASWVVSPFGFNWVEGKDILAPGCTSDLDVIDNNGASKHNIFPYMLVTNAVPFMSGHRKRSPDEAHPKILQFAPHVSSETYFDLGRKAIRDTITSKSLVIGSNFLRAILGGTAEHAGNLVERVEACFGMSDQVVSFDFDLVDDEVFL